VEVVASLCQGRTAAAQCGLFTYKSVPVIFEPPCTSGKGKKCKFQQRTGNEIPEGEQSYNCILSLTSTLDGVEWSAPNPGLFTLGKEKRIFCTGDCAGPKAGLEWCRKYRPHRDTILEPSSP